MASIFQILIFSLLLETSKSFAFQQCQYDSGSNCLDDVYEQTSFTADFVNDLYQQNTYKYFLINVIDDSEIALNLDGFNPFLQFDIINQRELQVTIKITNEEISDKACFPVLNAENADIILDNLNIKNDKTIYISGGKFNYKSLTLKDATKPLYLIHYYGDQYSYYDINPNINQDTIYVGSRQFSISSFMPEKSLTIIASPIINYTSRLNGDDPALLKEASVHVFCPNNTNITYGKLQIKYEYENKKTLTLKSETQRFCLENHVHQGCIIDVENGLSANEIFVPLIFCTDKSSTIKGNWPILKSDVIPGEFLPNGSYIDSFDISARIDGDFYFAANHFPIYDIYSIDKLILTEKSTSIYMLHHLSYTNLTIETNPKNANDEFVFTIEGRSVQLKNDTYEYEGNIVFTYYCIITSSDKLTIVANTDSYANVLGPAKIVFKKIDNSNQNIDSTLPFLKGGTINIPFSIDYMETVNSLSEIYNSYISAHPEPDKNAEIIKWANYYIDFAKDKIADLSAKVNGMVNQLVPITVDVQQTSFSGNQKNKVVLVRNDFPFSGLYKNGLNKVSNAVCINSGTIDIKDWDVRIGTNILRGFFGSDEEEIADYFFEQFLPSFSDTKITGDIITNNNGKCIAFQQKSVPGSAFEIIIFTSNTTFSQIFEKIDLIVTLTPSDLDAFSKLKSTNSKNLIVVVLDDLPDGKSINLNGIREDANIFLFGFKTNQINEVFNLIEELNAINWSDYDNRDANDLLEKNIITKYASKYENYQPKASLTFGTVQSLMIGMVNYGGTHIKCTNFYPLLCKFSNLASLASDFSAAITLTESITYKLMTELQFNDLIIFPASIDPPNIFIVKQIDFTESQWKLELTGFINEPGLVIEGSSIYEINTAKVTGQLIIYSFTSNCVFNVPDTKEKQKIKGITINSHFTNFNIKEIPGIMTLEDHPKNIKKSIEKLSLNIMSKFFKFIFNPSSLILPLAHKKNMKLIREGEEEGEGEQDTISFTGNWDRVETITGSIEINTGDQPAEITNIPAVVANVLEVKSQQNVKLETKNKVMKFNQPQVITQSKTINFANEDMEVSFTNLTFKGPSTGLSLLLNEKASKVVTEHVLLTSETKAFVSGELEVKQSFEFGPSSSLSAPKITTNKPKLTMNYRLGDGFGSIPDSIEPSSIVLNYIGESNNDNSIPDFDTFLGTIIGIKNFQGENHQNKCNEWKGKTTLESLRYPEFRGDKPYIKVICTTQDQVSTLSVNVSAVPTGVVQDPDAPKDKDTPSKKKFPLGAIIGIVVGGVAVIVIVSVLIWFFVSKKKKIGGAGSESSP